VRELGELGIPVSIHMKLAPSDLGVHSSTAPLSSSAFGVRSPVVSRFVALAGSIQFSLLDGDDDWKLCAMAEGIHAIL
jgi:hypothetical protein